MISMNRVLSVCSLVIIFSLASFGHPAPTMAGQGCAEMVACSTEDACELTDGEECNEEGCDGNQVCVTDIHDECDEGPACSIFECEVALCAEWEN